MKHTRVQRHRRQTKRKGSRKGTRKQRGGASVCPDHCPNPLPTPGFQNLAHTFTRTDAPTNTHPNRVKLECIGCGCVHYMNN